MTADEYRKRAQEKVDAWLEGVDAAAFESALVSLVAAKASSGEYRFKRASDRELAMQGARRFFADFARKIVPLSDGRCVYFVPDARSSDRNASKALSWAEYAFHAVSSSGKLLDGKNFRERLYNATKTADLPVLEAVIQSEQCIYRLIDAHPENDAVIFVGRDVENERLEVVTRLDPFGNAEANLGEVTVIAKHKRKENPPPKFRPLTEVVEAVAKHQAAGFSPSTTVNRVSNSRGLRKGVNMTDISVIILAGKEELHIKRCLEKLAPLEPRQVFVVESQKGDRTHEIAESMGATTVWHEWPGMYGPQFNWALDNLPITTKWVLRLDADEYLEAAAIPELIGHLAADEPGVDAYALPLVRVWLGYRLKHGVETKILTRVFRHGVGRCEDRAMDEHISVPGETVVLKNGFVDDNLNGFDWWREKHIGYAKREALDGVNRFEKIPWGATVDMEGKPLSDMDRTKVKYYHLSRYLRAIVYWGMRYFLGKGFLDGIGGWRWNWWQGLWYRWQVDREISRLKREIRSRE